MERHTHRLAVPIAVIVVTGAVLWVRAGSLTPPAGPVAPTMRTLDQISADIAALPSASIKRVTHGYVEYPRDTLVATQTISPAIDPARSIVTLGPTVATGQPTSFSNTMFSRSGACVVSLTATTITIKVDVVNASFPLAVSYQIVEYN